MICCRGKYLNLRVCELARVCACWRVCGYECSDAFLPRVVATCEFDTCPLAQCPGWEGQAETLWGIILFSSLLSPLLVWLFLPFLRPETTQQGSDRWCAGVMSCSVSRVKSICGF